jgi:ABC-type Fe3+/spermidine/putrescine transport system ATPase subunit
MFDEPLGALDRNLREQLMTELRRILHASGVPAIYVTHDQEEAFSLADRVLLLHGGTIVRSGAPEQVWEDPGSVWAAQFLDAGNVVAGTIISGSLPYLVETSVGIIDIGSEIVPVLAKKGDIPVQGQEDHKHSPGEKVDLLISRRNVQLGSQGNISGEVTDVVFRPNGFKVTLANGLDFYLPDAPRIGDKINLVIPKGGIKCLS